MIRLLFRDSPPVFPLRVREIIANAFAHGIENEYQIIDANMDAE